MSLNPIRRVREARRKAEETDRLFDELVEESRVVYSDVARSIMRAREELAIEIHERSRRAAGNGG